MGVTKIEWSDFSWNPWIGCAKTGQQECAHCYAEQFALRWMSNEKLWGRKADRHVTSDNYWKQPLKWNKQAKEEGKKKFVFCASLADWAEEREDLNPLRDRLFDLINQCPNLIFQLLTKRYEYGLILLEKYRIVHNNVILGFTAGTVRSCELISEAIIKLQGIYGMFTTPYFLSCEPLLENISDDLFNICYLKKPAAIIVGGESGNKARPMHAEWAKSIRHICLMLNIPYMFKQWGQYIPVSQMTMEQLEDITRKGVDEKDNRLIHVQSDNYSETFVNLGKHETGRLLDYKEYNGMPELDLQVS